MTDYDAQVLLLSPDGYWKCDEASGLSLADSSGHGHPLVGTAFVENYRVPGPSAADIPVAMDFINTGFPACATATVGSYGVGASFTVETWYGSVGAIAANIGVVTKGYTTAELRPWWSLVMTAGGVPVFWFRNVAGTDYKCTGYGNLSDATYTARGPFHHLVGTYTPGTADLYVDGYHQAQLAVPNTGWGTGGGGLTLNNLNANIGGPWQAAVAIYPGQLSAAQVLSNFQLGITGNAFTFTQQQAAFNTMTADLAEILAAVKRRY